MTVINDNVVSESEQSIPQDVTVEEALPMVEEEDTVVVAPSVAASKHDLIARVLAEFAGSMLICLAIYYMCTFGTAFYNFNLAFIALGTGVIYAAMTAIFGKISSAQFNPAITVAAMLTSKTRVVDGVLYIIAQIVGAICAGAVFMLTLPTSQTVAASQWYQLAINGFDAGSISYTSMNSLGLTFGSGITIVVELLASLIVVCAAMRTIKNNGKETRSHAVVMGIAYAAATAVCFPITGASINPIRATGIAIFAQGKGLRVEPLSQLWVFWVSAIFAAAVIAMIIIIAQLAHSKNNADNDLLVNDPAEVAIEEDEAERFARDEGSEDNFVYGTPVNKEHAEEEVSVQSESDTQVKSN